MKDFQTTIEPLLPASSTPSTDEHTNDNLDPPSTGNTPPVASSPTTRATSAEEGIWKDPFGLLNLEDNEMSGQQPQSGVPPMRERSSSAGSSHNRDNNPRDNWQDTGFSQQQLSTL